MMDPLTGQNRGYAFITFKNKSGAQNAVKQVSLFLKNIQIVEYKEIVSLYLHWIILPSIVR